MSESSPRLLPLVQAHANLLAASTDPIDPPHARAGAELVDWIVANLRPAQPLHATVVCTGNSRRSILGATMGNIAATYHGFQQVVFHSGGTAPTAFNPRSIATLQAIGVVIAPTGSDAPRHEPMTVNPIYTVQWGEPGLRTLEFSKHYLDPTNPQTGFVALMVCDEADFGCPIVSGAAARISMPYLDPKIFDDTPLEAQKYAERRDELGRLMLQVFSRVRDRIGPAHPSN